MESWGMFAPLLMQKVCPVEITHTPRLLRILHAGWARVEVHGKMHDVIQQLFDANKLEHDPYGKFNSIRDIKHFNCLFTLLSHFERVQRCMPQQDMVAVIEKQVFGKESCYSRPWNNSTESSMATFLKMAFYGMGITSEQLFILLKKVSKERSQVEGRYAENDIIDLSVDHLVNWTLFSDGKLNTENRERLAYVLFDGEQTRIDLFKRYLQFLSEEITHTWEHLCCCYHTEEKPPEDCPTFTETEEIRSYYESFKGQESGPNLRNEFNELLLKVVNSSERRKGKLKRFNELTCDENALSAEGRHLLKLINDREHVHIYAMSVAWPEIYALHFRENLPYDYPWHDHSKDSLFMFIIASYFDLKLEYEDLSKLANEELSRHYFLERHHPEHEFCHRCDGCLDVDILEMAVDHLMRAAQFSDGMVDMGGLRKLEPTFNAADKERKFDLYQDFMQRYQKKALEIWERLFGDQLQKRKEENQVQGEQMELVHKEPVFGKHSFDEDIKEQPIMKKIKLEESERDEIVNTDEEANQTEVSEKITQEGTLVQETTENFDAPPDDSFIMGDKHDGFQEYKEGFGVEAQETDGIPSTENIKLEIEVQETKKEEFHLKEKLESQKEVTIPKCQDLSQNEENEHDQEKTASDQENKGIHYSESIMGLGTEASESVEKQHMEENLGKHQVTSLNVDEHVVTITKEITCSSSIIQDNTQDLSLKVIEDKYGSDGIIDDTKSEQINVTVVGIASEVTDTVQILQNKMSTDEESNQAEESEKITQEGISVHTITRNVDAPPEDAHIMKDKLDEFQENKEGFDVEAQVTDGLPSTDNKKQEIEVQETKKEKCHLEEKLKIQKEVTVSKCQDLSPNEESKQDQEKTVEKKAEKKDIHSSTEEQEEDKIEKTSNVMVVVKPCKENGSLSESLLKEKDKEDKKIEDGTKEEINIKRLLAQEAMKVEEDIIEKIGQIEQEKEEILGQSSTKEDDNKHIKPDVSTKIKELEKEREEITGEFVKNVTHQESKLSDQDHQQDILKPIDENKKEVHNLAQAERDQEDLWRHFAREIMNKICPVEVKHSPKLLRILHEEWMKSEIQVLAKGAIDLVVDWHKNNIALEAAFQSLICNDEFKPIMTLVEHFQHVKYCLPHEQLITVVEKEEFGKDFFQEAQSHRKPETGLSGFLKMSFYGLGISYEPLESLVANVVKNQYESELCQRERIILDMAVDHLLHWILFCKEKSVFQYANKLSLQLFGGNINQQELYMRYVKRYYTELINSWDHIRKCYYVRTEPPKQRPTEVKTEQIRTFFQSLEDKGSVRSEYEDILNDVINFSNLRDDRKERFDRLVQEGESLSPEGNQLLQLIKGREATHIYAVAFAWPKVYEMKYGKKLPEDYPWHDHTKDTFFMFLLAAHFDLKLKNEKLPEMVNEELSRHYFLERHHPEHEFCKMCKGCSSVDILEMAVDRMMRNAQFNGGLTDMDTMRRFEPTFYACDKDKKLSMYWKFVDEYKDEVMKTWRMIYGDPEEYQREEYPKDVKTVHQHKEQKMEVEIPSAIQSKGQIHVSHDDKKEKEDHKEKIKLQKPEEEQKVEGQDEEEMQIDAKGTSANEDKYVTKDKNDDLSSPKIESEVTKVDQLDSEDQGKNVKGKLNIDSTIDGIEQGSEKYTYSFSEDKEIQKDIIFSETSIVTEMAIGKSHVLASKSEDEKTAEGDVTQYTNNLTTQEKKSMDVEETLIVKTIETEKATGDTNDQMICVEEDESQNEKKDGDLSIDKDSKTDEKSKELQEEKKADKSKGEESPLDKGKVKSQEIEKKVGMITTKEDKVVENMDEDQGKKYAYKKEDEPQTPTKGTDEVSDLKQTDETTQYEVSQDVEMKLDFKSMEKGDSSYKGKENGEDTETEAKDDAGSKIGEPEVKEVAEVQEQEMAKMDMKNQQEKVINKEEDNKQVKEHEENQTEITKEIKDRQETKSKMEDSVNKEEETLETEETTQYEVSQNEEIESDFNSMEIDDSSNKGKENGEDTEMEVKDDVSSKIGEQEVKEVAEVKEQEMAQQTVETKEKESQQPAKESDEKDDDEDSQLHEPEEEKTTKDVVEETIQAEESKGLNEDIQEKETPMKDSGEGTTKEEDMDLVHAALEKKKETSSDLGESGKEIENDASPVDPKKTEETTKDEASQDMEEEDEKDIEQKLPEEIFKGQKDAKDVIEKEKMDLKNQQEKVINKEEDNKQVKEHEENQTEMTKEIKDRQETESKMEDSVIKEEATLVSVNKAMKEDKSQLKDTTQFNEQSQRVHKGGAVPLEDRKKDMTAIKQEEGEEEQDVKEKVTEAGTKLEEFDSKAVVSPNSVEEITAESEVQNTVATEDILPKKEATQLNEQDDLSQEVHKEGVVPLEEGAKGMDNLNQDGEKDEEQDAKKIGAESEDQYFDDKGTKVKMVEDQMDSEKKEKEIEDSHVSKDKGIIQEEIIVSETVQKSYTKHVDKKDDLTRKNEQQEISDDPQKDQELRLRSSAQRKQELIKEKEKPKEETIKKEEEKADVTVKSTKEGQNWLVWLLLALIVLFIIWLMKQLLT